jgi:hypothetical protein
MQQPEQHRIEASAERLFNAALPLNWVPRKQTPDYGIDFEVEVFEDNQQTGLRFYVQLKGTKSPHYEAECVSFRLSTKHLAHYVDKERMPVFLVVMDVESKQGYWLFLQQYAIEFLAGQPWRDKKTISVHLPKCNCLSDAPKLREAVTASDRFMANLRPGAIHSSIKAERVRLESLDPRFAIHIEATEGGVHHTVHAKEPVEFEFVFRGPSPDIDRKLEDLFGRGLPVTFAPTEIDVGGLPLIAEAIKQGGTLQVTRKVGLLVDLVAVDENGGERARIRSIPVELEGGRSELRFSGGQLGSPLRLHGFLVPSSKSNRVPIRVSMKFNFEVWFGQPVSSLPCFKPIRSFLQAVAEDGHLRLEFFHLGEPVYSASGQVPQGDHFAGPHYYCDTLNMLNAMIRQFGISPPLLSGMSNEEVAEIRNLWHLIRYAGEPHEGRGKKFTGKITRKAIPEFVESWGHIRPPGNVEIVESRSYSLLGQVWCVEVEYTLSRARLSPDPQALMRMYREGGSQDVDVEWTGTGESQLTVRICKFVLGAAGTA